MALRIRQARETVETIEQRRLKKNNFTPQAIVEFPADVAVVTEDSIMAGDEFQSLSSEVKNTGLPVLIRISDGLHPAMAALAIGGRYVLISDFSENGNGNYPMFSPNGNHIYLDVTDYRRAATARDYRRALDEDTRPRPM